MEKFVCLRWLLNRTALGFAEHRLVFNEPEGPGEDLVEAEAAPEEKDEHQEHLDALAAAKDDPEALAAALENALTSLEGQYQEKADERVADGETQLTQLLTAMGIDTNGEEGKAIMEEYKSTFTAKEYGFFGDQYNTRERELQTANEGQKEEALGVLKTETSEFLGSQFDIMIERKDSEITSTQARVDYWERKATMFEQAVPKIEDQISAANDNFAEWAETYGVPTTIEEFSNLPDEELSKMVREQAIKQDPNWEVDNNPEDQVRAVSNRITKLRTEAQKVSDAQEKLVSTQAIIEEARSYRQVEEMELSARKQEKTDLQNERQAALDEVEAGTFAYMGEPTLAEQAQALADSSISTEEQAIIDKYAEVAAGKTRELVREVAYKQLEKMYESIDQKMEGVDSRIAHRTEGLKAQTQKKEEALTALQTQFGIDRYMGQVSVAKPSETEAVIRRILEKGVRDQKTEAQLIDGIDPDKGINTVDDVVKMYADRRYDVYGKSRKDFHDSQKRELTDSILTSWIAKKEELQGQADRIQGAMDQLQA